MNLEKLESEVLLELLLGLDSNKSEAENVSFFISFLRDKLFFDNIAFYKEDAVKGFEVISSEHQSSFYIDNVNDPQTFEFYHSGAEFQIKKTGNKYYLFCKRIGYVILVLERNYPFDEKLALVIDKALVILEASTKNIRYSKENEKNSHNNFPSENPNPVLRFDYDLNLLFANDASKLHFVNEFGVEKNAISNEVLRNNLSDFIESEDILRTFYIGLNNLTYSISVKKIIGENYFNVYVTDISEYLVNLNEKEKELEIVNENLNKQREFYEFILDHLPEDIAVFDRNHRYLYVNPEGIKDPEIRKFIIGKDDFDYCDYRNKPYDLAINRREIFNQIVDSKESSSWEDTINTTNGVKYISRKMTPLLDKDGNVFLVIGYGLDITKRKIAENELIAVNSKLKLLESFVKFTGDAIQVADEDGNMVYVNKIASDRLGIPEDAPENYHVSDFEPLFKDKTIWFEHLEGLKKSNITILSENKNALTGKSIFVEVNAKYEFINNKGYIIAISRDVTDRRTTELELINTKQKLESILNEMTDVIWSLSYPQGLVIFYTPSIEKLYEIDSKEWLKDARLWRKSIHIEDKHYIELIDTALREKGAFDYTYRIVCPSGKVKWVRNKGKLIFDKSDKPIRVDGITTDVTEIQLSFERQKQFIRDAPTSIVMLDDELRYLVASENWHSYFGLKEEEIQGKNILQIFPSISDHWKKYVQLGLNGESISKEEEKIVRSNGSIIWLKWKIKPWFKDVNQVGGIIILTEDITRIKESKEEELRNILKLTQSQNDRLKNFAHIVSHNLRSHSGNIQSLLYLIKEEIPDIKEFEIIQMLDQASDNLMETITHLSEVAALNVKENVEFSEVNLGSTVEKAIYNVSALARTSNVQIINLLDREAIILGVPAYCDSIMLNFLTNGIKYRSDRKDCFIKIYSEKTDNHLIIHFEDNGLGIDLKRHGSKLFGMYKTFHRNNDARGIGLFITKNQIEAMGGRITVKSEIGLGTRFTITFPLH